MASYVVAGIGTGVGKTIVSAMLVETLEADYWKPVQAGDLENSDTLKVKQLVTTTKTVFHPEAYRLNTPISPHASAQIDGIHILPEKLHLPWTENKLIVELAGGLMVPLNEGFLNIDLVKIWNLPVILVSQNYLGSINHTLLSLELLKLRNITIHGIIFNGEKNTSTEDFILNHSGIKRLGTIPNLVTVDRTGIKRYAEELKQNFEIH